MAFSIDEFPYSSEYDSDLREVIKTMRKVLAKVETWDETVAELQTQLNNISGLYTRVSSLESVTSDLGTIRTNIYNLQQSLAALQTKHNQDITNVKNIIANQVKLLQQQIDTLEVYTQRLNKDITRLRTYVDSRFNRYDAAMSKHIYDVTLMISEWSVWLTKQIDDFREEINAIDTSALNPWHTNEGRINIQKNLKHAYNELGDMVLTATQYCQLGYDAQTYMELDITARDYAEFGKDKLRWNWFISPAYGYKQARNNILQDAITFVERTLDADSYTALDIDAESYGELDLTADDYYRYGEQSLQSWVDSKQKRLIAGKNITIADNESGDPVISAAGVQPIGLDVYDNIADFHFVEYDSIVDIWVEDGVCIFSKIPRELAG